MLFRRSAPFHAPSSPSANVLLLGRLRANQPVSRAPISGVVARLLYHDEQTVDRWSTLPLSRAADLLSVARVFVQEPAAWRARLDDETRHYAEIIRAKQDRLNILDVQAAKYGIGVPPHIEMERGSLRDELGMIETAVASPARAEISDELGARGRFVVNHQQNREIKQSIAAIAVKLDRFIDDSTDWRTMHRQILLIIGGAVLALVIAVAIIVTYLVTKGAL